MGGKKSCSPIPLLSRYDCLQWLCREMAVLCPGTELFKYDLGCGVSEQDDLTLLQGKAEFTEWRLLCIVHARRTRVDDIS
jgi:hypothetical protein